VELAVKGRKKADLRSVMCLASDAGVSCSTGENSTSSPAGNQPRFSATAQGGNVKAAAAQQGPTAVSHDPDQKFFAGGPGEISAISSADRCVAAGNALSSIPPRSLSFQSEKVRFGPKQNVQSNQ
jgi:hypothetical protein